MTVLAIDPGSNTFGWAVYKNNELVDAGSYSTMKSNRFEKMFDMVSQIADLIFLHEPEVIVSEEPLLQGKSNTSMQRLLGWTECLAYHLNEYIIQYIAPMSVKAHFGSGRFEKNELAKAVQRQLNKSQIFDNLILSQNWDATDAVAVGLMYIQKENQNGNNDDRSVCNTTKKSSWSAKKKTTKSARNCKSIRRRLSRSSRKTRN